MQPILPELMPDTLAEITTAARAYYRQSVALHLTATDFFDWLELLPVAQRAELEHLGFAVAGHQLAFLRHCLEQRGYSMREHMMAQLSVTAYELWRGHYEFNGDLPDSLCFS